jgi:hypothetical protein
MNLLDILIKNDPCAAFIEDHLKDNTKDLKDALGDILDQCGYNGYVWFSIRYKLVKDIPVISKATSRYLKCLEDPIFDVYVTYEDVGCNGDIIFYIRDEDSSEIDLMVKIDQNIINKLKEKAQSYKKLYDELNK